MDLSVIIPTRDRREILAATLMRLEAQHADADFEVVVASDGSRDGTGEFVREEQPGLSYPLTLIELPGLGPAAARHRALEVASAPVCLFIDDDAWPKPGLLRRHRDFHRTRRELHAALLGH